MAFCNTITEKVDRKINIYEVATKCYMYKKLISIEKYLNLPSLTKF